MKTRVSLRYFVNYCSYYDKLYCFAHASLCKILSFGEFHWWQMFDRHLHTPLAFASFPFNGFDIATLSFWGFLMRHFNKPVRRCCPFFLICILKPYYSLHDFRTEYFSGDLQSSRLRQISDFIEKYL